jgi:hypothetical protein
MSYSNINDFLTSFGFDSYQAAFQGEYIHVIVGTIYIHPVTPMAVIRGLPIKLNYCKSV